MSKPKLALIPSGYKSGKVYSILPNDATGDFDFTRQSIGTRVRKDGLIEEAKTVGSITNELLYSEEFTGLNWANVNTTITADQELAPNGTNTADKIARTSTSSSYTAHTISKSTTSKKFTTSVYLKKGSHDYFALRTQGSYPSRVDIRFRFDTEQIYYAQAVSNFTLYDYGVEVLANDWYRLHYSYETDTHSSINVTFSPRHTDGNIDSSDSGSTAHAFVWGAMVSEGALSDYIKTEGSSETKTVETFTDVPRLDWYNSNCPSLLLEPQRTNLVVKSETLTNTGNASTGWNSATFGSGTISVDSGFISPTGELNAYKFTIGGVATGNNGCLHVHDDYLGTRFISAGDYSISVWLKGEVGGEIVPVDFRSRTSAGETGDEFTLTTEWKLYTVTVNKASASNTTGGFQFRFYNRSDISDQVFYAFGCQIEQAPYSSSYIKADNGSTVTRLKDECLNGGDSDLFDITEGTFFADITPYDNEGANTTYILLSDGSTLNRIIFIFYGNLNQVRFFLSSNASGSTVNYLSHYQSISFNQKNKLAFTFKKDELKCYANGSLVHTISSALVPINLESLDFSTSAQNSSFFEGKVHDTRVYDRVLTEAEAIELTTL